MRPNLPKLASMAQTTWHFSCLHFMSVFIPWWGHSFLESIEISSPIYVKYKKEMSLSLHHHENNPI